MYQIANGTKQLRTEPTGPYFLAAQERSTGHHTPDVYTLLADGALSDCLARQRSLGGGVIYRKADGAIRVDGQWIHSQTGAVA